MGRDSDGTPEVAPVEEAVGAGGSGEVKADPRRSVLDLGRARPGGPIDVPDPG